MKLNRLLLSAGLLGLLTAGVHLFAGTKEIQDPLLTSPLAPAIRYLLLACWHLVSVTLTVSAAAFVWCAWPGRETQARALALVLGLLWLLFGLFFIGVDLVFLGLSGLGQLPQWVLLLPVGLLGCLGARQSQSSPGSAAGPARTQISSPPGRPQSEA